MNNHYCHLSQRQRTFVMIPLLLGGFIALLNETLLNVAFPQLMSSLHVSTSTVQWLATAYMLIIGVSVPVIAFLLETFTTKKLYLLAMSLFLVGTMFCGLSNTFPLLLISRMIQGIGTGMLIPIMMNTVLAIYPPEKRGSAMGLSLIVVVMAPAIGPSLSGLVLQRFNWHWLFYLIVPLAIVAMAISAVSLKNISALSRPPIDVFSLILSTIGFGGLIFGICSIESMGFSNPTVVISLIAGVSGLFLFVMRQLTLQQPLLEMRTFRFPMFSLGIVLLMISFMLPFSLNIILPTYMQSVFGMSPFAAGLALLPGGIITGIFTPLSGRIFDKAGAKPLMLTGFSLLAITMFFLSRLSVTTSLSSIIALHCFTFLGISLINTPVQTNTLNQLPKEYYPHGIAIINTLQQIAAAFGSSLFIGMLGAVQSKYLLKYPFPSADQQKAAIITGVDVAFTASFILILVALALSLLIRRKQAPTQAAELSIR